MNQNQTTALVSEMNFNDPLVNRTEFDDLTRRIETLEKNTKSRLPIVIQFPKMPEIEFRVWHAFVGSMLVFLGSIAAIGLVNDNGLKEHTQIALTFVCCISAFVAFVFSIYFFAGVVQGHGNDDWMK